MPLVPIVVERSGREERAMDIFSRLLQDRIIMIGSPIDDVVANLVIAQLLVLAHQDGKSEIGLYINSPGGGLTSTLAIYDTMQFIECPVATYCVGKAAAGAAILLAGGTKGKRYALPHSKIMLHQPAGYITGQVSDITIQTQEIVKNTRIVEEILGKRCGKTPAQIAHEIQRERYMTALEAKENGLIDHVVEAKADAKDEASLKEIETAKTAPVKKK